MLRIALVLALLSPVAAIADPAPGSQSAQTQQPAQAATQALADAAAKQAEQYRIEAQTYRQWFIQQSDQLAAALAICGAPCSQPQQPQQGQRQ